jgi:hypothetical protein
MKELGIQTIPAYSPQARVEANGASALGKGVCLKSCVCVALPVSRLLTLFFVSSTLNNSIPVYRHRGSAGNGLCARRSS